MTNEELIFLVEQHRLTEEKLAQLRKDLVRMESLQEMYKDLESELQNELKIVRISGDSEMVKFWQDLIDNYLRKDKDRPTQREIKEAQKKVFGENAKLIRYYEKKLKIVKQLLGTRQAEIMENYTQKNILMGLASGSGLNFHELEEEDSEELRKEKEKKNRATFDKM